MELIRKRISSIDDKKIFFLIEKELFPYTRRLFPSAQFNNLDEYGRLERGVTYVIARGYRSPVGFVLLNTQSIKDKIIWIEMLAVDRKYQGKGLGSALVAKAEQYGKKKGCIESRLVVDRDNSDAQQFYLKKGYSRVEYIPNTKSYIYSKRLTV
jgi:GNAT superfamily N-acetyltransferase